MTEYHGGTKVEKGVYINRANGELVQLYGRLRVLPGDNGVRYYKIPAILAVVGGPFTGLAFVMFLPFIGIIGMVAFLIYKAWYGTVALGRKVFQPVAVRTEPGVAYLTQRRGMARKEEPNGKDARPEETVADIEQLADEVAQRRQQGEK